jgi:branched-chain amino acid transport system ATP-binding protein
MDTVVRAIERQDDAASVAVVFVEHDMDIVRRYATRVAAFYSGRVIADGAPAAVLDQADVRKYVSGSAVHAGAAA